MDELVRFCACGGALKNWLIGPEKVIKIRLVTDERTGVTGEESRTSYKSDLEVAISLEVA